VSRFFFHLCEDRVLTDEEGGEFPDAASAIMAGLAYARDVAAADVRAGHLRLSHSIRVMVQGGEEIATISFDEAVKVVP